MRTKAVGRGSIVLLLIATIGVFSGAATDSATTASPSTQHVGVPTKQQLDARRIRLEGLSVAEREQLAAKFEQFQKLPAERRDQLRRLDAELAADPHADELRKVLSRYHEWLKTLLPPDRAELLSLEPEKRIARIRELKLQQQSRSRYSPTGRWPAPIDIPVLLRWANDYVKEHRDDLLAELPVERRLELGKDDFRHRRSLMILAAQRWRSGKLAASETQAVYDRLSADSRKSLDEAATPQAKMALVGEWLQNISRSRVMGGMRGWPRQDELNQFFEKSLTPAERQRIQALPREEQAREIGKLFRQRRRPDDGASGGGFSPRGSGANRDGGEEPEERPTRGNGPRRGGPGRGTTSDRAEPAGS